MHIGSEGFVNQSIINFVEIIGNGRCIMTLELELSILQDVEIFAI